MDPHGIPFIEIPHTPALFSDFLYRFARVQKFYAHDPFDTVSYAAAARAVALEPERRQAVADVLAAQNRRFGAGGDTLENIERLREARTVAVVTGQQTGLFGGPAFSAYKALSAVRLADQLTREGLPAVPVFWLASEDHDFAEVNHCWLLDAQQELVALRDTSEPPAHTPVGRVAFDRSIETLQSRAASLWPAGAAEAQRLLAGYVAGKSYAEAFARLFLGLFAGCGLVVLDPLDAKLHAQAQPLLRRALEEAEGLRALVRARDRELEQAGYHVQVRLRENATLLFLFHNGRREPLRRRANGEFLAGQARKPLGELLEELDAAPESFSPNVLLRPIVQDWLLPTAAYVAGPNEIAYFAQASALYEKLLGRMPVIVPRASLTLVEPKVARIMKKYQLSLPALFHGQERLRERLAERHLPRGLARRLAAMESRLDKMLAEAKKEVKQLDSTLAGAADTSRRKMLYQFEKLRRKAAHAQAERTEILERHLVALTNALYPEGGLQERHMSFLSFVARHGLPLVDRLLQEATVPAREHQVIFL